MTGVYFPNDFWGFVQASSGRLRPTAVCSDHATSIAPMIFCPFARMSQALFMCIVLKSRRDSTASRVHQDTFSASGLNKRAGATLPQDAARP